MSDPCSQSGRLLQPQHTSSRIAFTCSFTVAQARKQTLQAGVQLSTDSPALSEFVTLSNDEPTYMYICGQTPYIPVKAQNTSTSSCSRLAGDLRGTAGVPWHALCFMLPSKLGHVSSNAICRVIPCVRFDGDKMLIFRVLVCRLFHTTHGKRTLSHNFNGFRASVTRSVAIKSLSSCTQLQVMCYCVAAFFMPP